jgi:hypothetical protein
MGAIGVWGYFNLFTCILLCHPSGYSSVSSIRTFNDEVVLYDTDDFNPLFEPGVEGIVDFDKVNFMGIL